MSIFTSINKKILFPFFAIILIFILMWIFIKYYFDQKEQIPVPISTSTFQVPPTSLSTSTISTSTTQGLKTYRNTEWGFEFWYPQDLIIRENSFKSYYSKFNLELLVKIGEQFDPAFLVNIVLPEFAERSFSGLEKIISEIIVDDVKGVKYQYEYQGFLRTTIILSIGESRMILATGEGSKQYLDEFNQILASFKFLK